MNPSPAKLTEQQAGSACPALPRKQRANSATALRRDRGAIRKILTMLDKSSTARFGAEAPLGPRRPKPALRRPQPAAPPINS